MQIIINRVALLMFDRRRVERLKWTVAIVIGAVNISVFVIWIPARLQISPTWIHINQIWDRVEKVIFCLVDGGLNLYFVYLVRTMLIEYGLTKYKIIFRWNLAMIFLSLSLDVSSYLSLSRLVRSSPTKTASQVTIIGIMSLPNDMV